MIVNSLHQVFANLSDFIFSSPRRPGPDGEGGIEAWDGMSPLHLACEAGLDNVVQTLVEHKVNVNSKVCWTKKILCSTGIVWLQWGKWRRNFFFSFDSTLLTNSFSLFVFFVNWLAYVCATEKKSIQKKPKRYFID